MFRDSLLAINKYKQGKVSMLDVIKQLYKDAGVEFPPNGTAETYDKLIKKEKSWD